MEGLVVVVVVAEDSERQEQSVVTCMAQSIVPCCRLFGWRLKLLDAQLITQQNAWRAAVPSETKAQAWGSNLGNSA